MLNKASRNKLAKALGEYLKLDVRPSHLIIAVLVIVGVLVNMLLAHKNGWTVWPFVGAAGIMVYLNEAAERNGTGVPPFQAYAFFFGALAVWIGLSVLLSTINPFIFVIALVGLLFYTARQLIVHHKDKKLIDSRRKNGQCVFCGEVYDPNSEVCDNCGQEPNPDETRLARVAAIARGTRDAAKVRRSLSGQIGKTAKERENALIAKSHRHRHGKKG